MNHGLIKQSFHSGLHGGEDLQYQTLQPGDFIYCKRHPSKDSLERPHQVPLTNTCAAKPEGRDSWINVTYVKKYLNLGLHALW